MHDSLQKKQQIENRKLVLKSKQCEKILTYVNEKVRDNFNLFAQETENKKIILEMKTTINQLTHELDLAKF
jgi:hypothetical protein